MTKRKAPCDWKARRGRRELESALDALYSGAFGLPKPEKLVAVIRAVAREVVAESGQRASERRPRHAAACAVVHDRECGLCDCGAEDAASAGSDEDESAARKFWGEYYGADRTGEKAENHSEEVAFFRRVIQHGKDAGRASLEKRIETADAEVLRLKGLLDRDQTGLVAALAAVDRHCCGSWWISEGRGPYEWDDDTYRKEVGWLIDRILGVVKPAIARSGSIANLAFHPNDERVKPVLTFEELEKSVLALRKRVTELEASLGEESQVFETLEHECVQEKHGRAAYERFVEWCAEKMPDPARLVQRIAELKRELGKAPS